MLEKVQPVTSVEGHRFMNFSAIERYQSGTGICLVYNAVMKRTKQGKPFITLFLKDTFGATIPGYVFDLASPLFAGGEVVKLVGQLAEVEWQENYLDNIGLTVILSKVSLVTGVQPSVRAMFSGSIENLSEKEKALKDLFMRHLHLNVSLPSCVPTYASPDYMQGRVGGLLEYYYRMSKVLESMAFLPDDQCGNLIATFAIYLCIHSAYVRASESGNADITLVTTLTDMVGKLSNQLHVGEAAMEMVHMFFGYRPKDVYVRAVMTAAEFVQRTDKEFALYKTIPLLQEGDAGYGAIRRYALEKGAGK